MKKKTLAQASDFSVSTIDDTLEVFDVFDTLFCTPDNSDDLGVGTKSFSLSVSSARKFSLFMIKNARSKVKMEMDLNGSYLLFRVRFQIVNLTHD